MDRSPSYPSNWNGDAGFALFESRTNLERTQPQLRLYRLERMQQLLERLGAPHLAIPTIHVAGSKGKGSVSAYMASLLAATGATVGLYTSPHITGYRERFTVIPPGHAAGEETDDPRSAGGARYEEALAAASFRLRTDLEELQATGAPEDELPTTFELLTALAFLLFPALGCDWVVLETGLGGRLDATNVCLPEVSVITRIEREHTEYLGNTLEQIAREKGGIIKAGIPIVCAEQRPEVTAVLRSIAEERRAPFVESCSPIVDTEETVELPDWAGASRIKPAMIGSFQRRNILQALTVFRLLTEAGQTVVPSQERISHVLSRCRLPGRGERIEDLFLDGAHTPESVAGIARYYLRTFGRDVRIPVIIGIVAGKDVEGIAQALLPIAGTVIVSTPGNFKPGDPRAVTERLAAILPDVQLIEDALTALKAARKLVTPPAPPILVTGSFYMVAEIRRLVLS